MMNKKNIVTKNTTMRKAELPKNYVLQIGKEQQLNFGRWLPCVAAKYESILQELGLSYKVKEDGSCSFWDPEVYKEDTVTLPVFRQVANTKDLYICTGQTQVTVPSYKTVGKAVEAKKAVMNRIEQIKNAATKVDRAYLDKVLGTKTAKVVRIKNAEVAKDLGEGIKVLPAVKASGEQTGLYGIFNTDKLKYVLAIKLVVPERSQSIIEGEGGQNQQYWEYMLGKKIELILV